MSAAKPRFVRRLVCLLGVSKGIGFHILEHLVESEAYEIVVVDDSLPAFPCDSNIHWLTADLKSKSEVFETLKLCSWERGLEGRASIDLIIVNAAFDDDLRYVPFTCSGTTNALRQILEFAGSQTSIVFNSLDPSQSSLSADDSTKNQVIPAFHSPATEMFFHHLLLKNSDLRILTVHEVRSTTYINPRALQQVNVSNCVFAGLPSFRRLLASNHIVRSVHLWPERPDRCGDTRYQAVSFGSDGKISLEEHWLFRGYIRCLEREQHANLTTEPSGEGQGENAESAGESK